MSVFQKATREQVRLRMTLDGPAGSGKTFTALRCAMPLVAEFGPVAVINTEAGSINKYIGDSPDDIPFAFDIITIDDFAPSQYTEKILAAGREKYGVLIIDSLSHAWEGKGGALDQVDKSAGASKFTSGWKDVTPQHRNMVEAILHSPCHIITTMRTKTEYVLEPNERGQMVPRRVGMKPIQREGMDYEFDIVCDIDTLHVLKVSKTRCHGIDGMVVMKPGAEFMRPVISWLKDGSDVSADFFKVREEDLASVAARNRRIAVQEPKKSVNFRDQITGGPAAGATAPATETTSTPTPTPCTDNQAVHIRGLFQQIGIPPEVAKSVIEKRGVSAVKDLSYKQAESLIDNLLAMLKQAVIDRRAEQDTAEAESKRKAKELADEVPF